MYCTSLLDRVCGTAHADFVRIRLLPGTSRGPRRSRLRRRLFVGSAYVTRAYDRIVRSHLLSSRGASESFNIFDLCFRFAFFCLSTEHEQTHSLVRTRNHVTIHVECVVWTVRWCVARARRRIHALVTSARIWSHHTPHHASRHPTCPVRSSACPCSHACETSRVSLTVSYTCQPTVKRTPASSTRRRPSAWWHNLIHGPGFLLAHSSTFCYLVP